MIDISEGDILLTKDNITINKKFTKDKFINSS